MVDVKKDKAMRSQISIDELLDEQSNPVFLATIEKVTDRNDLVMVTPWTTAGGCLCHLTVNLKKISLEGATPTGETHTCCGKTLKVVELHFKRGEAILLEDLFQQIHKKAVEMSFSQHPSRTGSYAPSLSMPGRELAPTPVSRFLEPNEGECLAKYFSCISGPPPGADYHAWVCQCRNSYKICTGKGLLELCPFPRY